MANYDEIRDARNEMFKHVSDPEAVDKQTEADSLMVELRTLDLGDPVIAVNWLDRFVNLSDTAGVFFDAEEVLRHYNSAGYSSGEGQVGTFQGTAEKVVGNALECLEDLGFLHPMVSSQIGKLRELYPGEFNIDQEPET